jgi:predicted O-methyltransferase YrrM
MSKLDSVLQRFFSPLKTPVVPSHTRESSSAQPQIYDVTDHAGQIDLDKLSVIKWTPAWLTRAERLMIYTLIFSLRPQRYLEIGTFQGGSALIVASALDALGSDGRIFCVDPNPKITDENWSIIKHRATMFTGYSPGILSEVYSQANGFFDFIFIDGDHTYNGVMRDAEGVMPYVTIGTYLLFHDSFFPEVSRGLQDFAARYPDRLVDCGPITREVTVHHEPGQEPVYWGGLHLMKVYA